MNLPRRTLILAGIVAAFPLGFWALTQIPGPVVIPLLLSGLWLVTGVVFGLRFLSAGHVEVLAPAAVEVTLAPAPEATLEPSDTEALPWKPDPSIEDNGSWVEALPEADPASIEPKVDALAGDLEDLLDSLAADWARPDPLGPGLQELLGNEAFIRENVQRSFEIADNLSGSAEHAFKLSERVQKGATVVTDALVESLRQTDILSGHSHRITSILTLMAEVSDKIHVLSINASIVSARAGAAGRGFEVVAKEIRALAKESESSLGGIVEVIGQLRASIGEVIRVVKAADAETAHEKNSLIEVAGALQGVSLGVEIVKAVSSFARDKAEEQEKLVRNLSILDRGPSAETQQKASALRSRLASSSS